MNSEDIKPQFANEPVDQKNYVDFEAVYIAMTLCCGMDGRYDFRRTFRKNDWVYASNGVILARVPAWCARWSIERPYTPDPSDQAWDRALYVESPTPWPKFPKPKSEKCSVCWGGARKDFPCSVHEITDHDLGNLMPCPSCGMLVTHEASNAVVLGSMVFNSAQVRRLASIGAEMYAPLIDDAKRPWRFTVDCLYMEGLVLPIATEAEYFKKDKVGGRDEEAEVAS